MTTAQFKTPPIPDWIRELSAPHYTNIFSLQLGNRNLHGTETLLGDWDGHILVIAKDFAPVKEVRRLRDQGVDPSRIYRHNDGDGRYETSLKTNRQLLRHMFGEQLVQSMITGARNTTCGALYINACFFLKDGDERSSSLPDWRPRCEAFERSWQVVKFVVEHMPNLKCVVCLGNDSYRMMTHRQSDLIGSIPLHKVPHPSRGSNDAHQKAWLTVYNDSGVRAVDGKILPAT